MVNTVITVNTIDGVERIKIVINYQKKIIKNSKFVYDESLYNTKIGYKKKKNIKCIFIINTKSVVNKKNIYI